MEQNLPKKPHKSLKLLTFFGLGVVLSKGMVFGNIRIEIFQGIFRNIFGCHHLVASNEVRQSNSTQLLLCIGFNGVEERIWLRRRKEREKRRTEGRNTGKNWLLNFQYTVNFCGCPRTNIHSSYLQWELPTSSLALFLYLKQQHDTKKFSWQSLYRHRNKISFMSSCFQLCYQFP